MTGGGDFPDPGEQKKQACLSENKADDWLAMGLIGEWVSYPYKFELHGVCRECTATV